MKEGQKLWTRDELLLVVNLYCKLPFGKLHRLNLDIVHLSEIIGRTPSSVAYKLVSFASLDLSLSARGIKGASNASKLDAEIWKEFFTSWDMLPFESEELLANFGGTTIEKLNKIAEIELPKQRKTRDQMVKVRFNQSFFRRSILASYNNTCCITGIQRVDLLLAGHIKPWSVDEKNRLNPRNGIALNSLHDRAFEDGLLTITTDYYKVGISSLLFKQKKSKSMEQYFLKYDNQDMILPSRFLPDVEFLKYHYENRFKP